VLAISIVTGIGASDLRIRKEPEQWRRTERHPRQRSLGSASSSAARIAGRRRLASSWIETTSMRKRERVVPPKHGTDLLPR